MDPKSWSRVSLACLQCRTRHVRCDATLPVCTRCLAQGKACSYLKSKRGGRPRKVALQSNLEPPVSQPAQAPIASCAEMPDMELEHMWNLYDTTTPVDMSLSDTQEYTLEGEATNNNLIGLYYEFFHGAHPFILPRRQFAHRKARQPESVKLLELVICWIGSMYAPHISSDWHETRVRLELRNTESHPSTAFTIQALLLYSIALHWNDQLEKSSAVLDSAICQALGMGMHRLDFAVTFGEGDAVLEESWRRTWWQVNITDLHVSASSHLTTWRTSGIEVTTELPCEEYEYESGKIPKPRPLQEYENREFAVETDDRAVEFSSFAHLIGLCRCFDMSLAGELRTEASLENISREIDAAVAAWCLLLPRNKKELVQQDGKVDELLFKANMLMWAYVVDVHRPLSALTYSAIESCSRCAPPAPPQALSPARAQESQIHTMKILHAIEKLTDLLTLPTRFVQHSPFIICMVAVTTIAQLAACRYVLRGRDLKVARARVRTAMGALKAYEDIWLLGKRTYREVGIVARELLGLNKAGVPMSGSETVSSDAQESLSIYDRPSTLPDSLEFMTGFEYPPIELDQDIWT